MAIVPSFRRVACNTMEKNPWSYMVRPEFYHHFLKKCQIEPNSQWQLQILFQKSNLHILKVQFLMELNLARFFKYQKFFPWCEGFMSDWIKEFQKLSIVHLCVTFVSCLPSGQCIYTCQRCLSNFLSCNDM